MHHPGSLGHSIGVGQFTLRLHRQIIQNRNEGFEPLHVRGQTGYLAVFPDHAERLQISVSVLLGTNRS